MENCKCDRCERGSDDEEVKKYMQLGCDEIEIVKEFCYLGDMVGGNDCTSRAVTARI